jgi:putative intracellular protease/amidase
MKVLIVLTSHDQLGDTGRKTGVWLEELAAPYYRLKEADAEATAALAQTVRLDSVSIADFDTVFYPGGHGPLWDLAEDADSIGLIEATVRSGKPIALVAKVAA